MRKVFLISCIVCIALKVDAYIDEKEEKLPTKCHVCKHMTRELSEELGRSGKKREILYMGQVFQKEPKKIPYKQSELRFIEALEDACSNVLDYKVHKDKPLSLRYEKVESMTFRTLKGLKKRGVKVDLGFPDQMWDSPDAEVTRLKSRCEQMVELYEDEISNWYWKLPDTNLTEWLCVERVLDEGEDDCLNETMPVKKDENGTTQSKEKEDNKEETKTEEKRNEEDEIEEEVEKKHDKKGKQKKTRKEKKKQKSPEFKREKDDKRDQENDSERIQKLIREQAEEQAKGRFRHDRYGHDDKRGDGEMDETKRKGLRDRLLAIRDPERLRRELRKIRTKELSEDEYYPKEPWEDRMDHHIPAEVRRDMRRRRYERLEDVEDFQREIEMRAIDMESAPDHYENFAIRETLHYYLDEAKTIRDKKELKKRLEDLDALSAILGGGGRRRHDEL